MIRTWICLFVTLAGCASPGMLRVRAMEVYPRNKEVEVVNGTDVKLPCTFKSTEPLSEDSVIVYWNFRPLKPGQEESVFHYQDGPFPPQTGRFKDHAVWSGDIVNGDASISLHNVQFSFNGTFSCEVRNPPDFEGFAGEIVLKVVQKASISDIEILAAAVGGGIGVVVVLLIIIVLIRRRLRHDDDDDDEDDEDKQVELRERKWKDPTAW